MDFVSIEGKVPEDLEIARLDLRDLPAKWYASRGESLRNFGDTWIKAGRTVALLVPSAAIRGEWNLLRNPAHPDFSQIKFNSPRQFTFDERMFS